LNGLLIQPAFLSPTVCGRLINFFQKNIDALGGADMEPSFSCRVIRFRSLSENAPHQAEVMRILRAVRFLVSQQIMEFFQTHAVFPEETQLVVWCEKMQQALHRDKSRSTTSYASVIYLNDYFEGGETFFVKHGNVKPKTGTMIAFHGASEEHGVTTIRSGTRYTLPCWFTNNPDFAE
jgi:2OG-Fe(II) oxygenase superfamily